MNLNEIVSVGSRSWKVTARGARVRQHVVVVTVETLSRLGYGGTTLERISAQAGISRGSILHQFPTRLDIMTAATSYMCDSIMGELRMTLERILDPLERLRSYPDSLWHISRIPPTLALMEIQLAARWDEGLVEAISPRMITFRNEVYAQLAADLAAVGIDRVEEFSALVQALGSAHQGFMLELNVSEVGSLVSAARLKLRRQFIAEVDRVWKSSRKSTA